MLFGMDGDIIAYHICIGEGPSGLLTAKVDHQCTMLEVSQFGHDAQGSIKAVLGEVHVPHVASGHLEDVKCMIVGCCMGKVECWFSPGVHQGNALVFKSTSSLSRFSFRTPQPMVCWLCWFMSHTP